MPEIVSPKIRPVQSAPPDRYCRLFKPVDPPFDLDVMTKLGRSMQNTTPEHQDETRIPFPNRTITLPAGFTYFGLFIDHDLSRDDTDLEDASDDLAKMMNGGGARLDLGHLYGEGPNSSRHGYLYQGDLFRLGEARLPNGTQFDLPLDDRGEPEAADEQSSGNIILRQLCTMFMKLHNQAVRELSTTTPAGERFQGARRRVRWQYQWIIRHEYLALICNSKVYQELFEDGYYARPLMIDWQTGGFSIPVEFSHAAFRFGHSMVRPAYRLNSFSPELALDKLFGDPGKVGPIPLSQAVDWSHFLQMGPRAENAMAIDTVIASPLFHLPSAHVHHVIKENPQPLPPELPVRTLIRGALVGLPTGEQVARQLGTEVLRGPKPQGYKRDPWADLDDLGLTGKTPLWYYVLLEAELAQRGAKLGVVGSRLIAEVIEGALRADPESFLTINGPGWKPPAWTAPDGRSVTVKRLFDVAKVVGLTATSS